MLGTMTTLQMSEAAGTAGAAMEQAVGVFMLHPETLAESAEAGYVNPLAGYVVGRAGVLGQATGGTVSAVFAVFEPTAVGMLWEQGLTVRGAEEASARYWDQCAGFARRHLDGVAGLGRIAELGERIIATAPAAGLPLYAGWRRMPLAEDAPARALQVMFVLRELRAGVHFNVLTISGITPVEAHMLNKGSEYTAMFGWPGPYADGADKADRYNEVEEITNRRMAELYTHALDADEAGELARLSVDALASLKANVAG